MPSSGRNRLTKQPYWFQNNGTRFYGFHGSNHVFGSVSWRRVPDLQYSLDRIVWVACMSYDFDTYREFDNEAEAKAYIEAITSLTND